jgi:hypothetical protein
MTFDTFEALAVGNRVKPTGKVRTYPVVRIGKRIDGRRVVYACLNPIAVEKRKDAPWEFGIFSAMNLEHSSHYLNWEKVS